MNKRKPRDTSKKRNSILDAAILTYKEHGYYGSSMDMVADKATASKRTLYNHFRSKEVLFQEVISRFLKGQQEISNLKFDTIRPIKEQLMNIAETEIYLIRSESNRGLSKVLTAVFLRDPELAVKTRSRFTKTRVNLLNWFIEAKCKLYIDDPVKELSVFISMIQGYITFPALFSNFTDKEIDIRKSEVVDRYLKGLK